MAKRKRTYDAFATTNKEGCYLALVVSEEKGVRPEFVITDAEGNTNGFMFDNPEQMNELFTAMSWVLP